MLRSRIPRVLGGPSRIFRRYQSHSVPPLVHGTLFRNEGIHEFLSPDGFDIAWTQYQALMIEKLNNLIAGTEYEHKTTKDIAIKYARDPSSAAIFNYASMAHNNALFFSTLSPQKVEMPSSLEAELSASFSSIETLRREMVLTAATMFGPGFVWLVRTREAGTYKFKLLTTYLAGSPYPGAHYRRQEKDMNTESEDPLNQHVRPVARMNPVGTIGMHGSLSKAPTAPGGVDAHPILCLNTWEHVYLRDYGVGAFGEGGKMEYAQRWWERVDWNRVADNAETGKSSQKDLMR